MSKIVPVNEPPVSKTKWFELEDLSDQWEEIDGEWRRKVVPVYRKPQSVWARYNSRFQWLWFAPTISGDLTANPNTMDFPHWMLGIWDPQSGRWKVHEPQTMRRFKLVEPLSRCGSALASMIRRGEEDGSGSGDGEGSGVEFTVHDSIGVVCFDCDAGGKTIAPIGSQGVARFWRDSQHWEVLAIGEGCIEGSGSGSADTGADCCAGTETALPGDDDCCPPGYVKISTKKFIDLVRFDGDDCNCETGSSTPGGSGGCGEEPSWATDPCDFTCFRFDPANIKSACANDCPCTDAPIDAAALDGNPMTRYLAADLPEYPDGDESLITTDDEVYYTSGHWLWKQKTGSRYEYHFRRDGGQFQIIDCTADVASIVESGNGLYLITALGDEYTIEIDGCGGGVDSSDSGPASTFCPEEGTACSLLTDHTPDTVRVAISHPEVSDRCRVCDQQETQGVFNLPQTAACNWQATVVTDLCGVSGNNLGLQVQILDNGGGSVSVVVGLYNSGGFFAPCFAGSSVTGTKVFPSGFDGTGQHSIPITAPGLNEAGWPYDWENVTFNVDFGNGDACP